MNERDERAAATAHKIVQALSERDAAPAEGLISCALVISAILATLEEDVRTKALVNVLALITDYVHDAEQVTSEDKT